MLSKKELRELMVFIEINLRKEFAKQHLSGNLINTLEFDETEDAVTLTIPARIYNFYQFQKNGVVIPRGNGSYASKLDRTGSEFVYYPPEGGRKFIKPHNHVGYVDKIINDAINQWLAEKANEYERISITDTTGE